MPAVIGRTAADGAVDVPAQTQWALLFIGMDFISEPTRVIITADGYRPWAVGGVYSGAPSFNRYDSLGRVALQPLSAGK